MRQITFIPKLQETEILVPKPKPASKYTPQWFKNIPAFENNKFSIDEFNQPNSTAKLCVPLADSFRMGYIQETWCDIYIESDPSTKKVKYYTSSPLTMINHRDNPSVPIGEEFYDIEFVWRTQWVPKVPDGYSVILTHPLNHIELPFMTFTGIVDSDKYYKENEGNHPFYIKKGFTGLIPSGTPFLQIIPFKRDSWESNFSEFDYKNQISVQLIKQYFWGGYKKLFWTKKEFK